MNLPRYSRPQPDHGIVSGPNDSSIERGCVSIMRILTFIFILLSLPNQGLLSQPRSKASPPINHNISKVSGRIVPRTGILLPAGERFHHKRVSSASVQRSTFADIPQTFTVTTVNDTGAGSLRKAITDANKTISRDSIIFNIGSGVQTIIPKTPLPAVTEPVVIDGTTQPGYTGRPLIELNGNLLAAYFNDIGLELDTSGCTVRGLVINRFASGIVVDVVGGDTVQGNFIGTDPSGLNPLPNIEIGVETFAPNNLIGGSASGEGNLISGNPRNIEVDGTYTTGYSGNRIQGNIIGMDRSGAQWLPGDPTPAGIFIYEATDDTIGGLDPGARNVICGNTDGIYIGNSPGAARTVIQGNFIGIDISGKLIQENARAGITVWNALNTQIGGSDHAARNTIAANQVFGIQLRSDATGIVIQGNYIGTDSSGTVTQFSTSGNGEGIYTNHTHDNKIGGTSPGEGNIISGNQDNGIFLDTMSTNITVEGNWIGATLNNGKVLPSGNLFNGIVVNASPRNIIGGTADGAGNTISANANHGILVTGDSANGNVIQGNYIGMDATLASGLGNTYDGILIDGSKNIIGGSASGAANTIEENGGVGVYILSGTGNLVSQNSISANGFLGIDLYPTGPNLDDTLDADSGPNTLQNFPVIDSILHVGFNTLIKGSLNSVPNNEYTIEFFENNQGDTSHYGEGETFIGSTHVTTDGAGNASFVFTGPTTPDNTVITSTATDTAGNTSEFSKDQNALTITAPSGGELWITEEPDTITWIFTGRFDSVTLGYSTDGGSTFQNISNAGSGAGQYIWHPPKGTLSKQCKVFVEDKDNPEVADTSKIFKIKGYELTRDSADQYIRFEPGRHGWKFANDSAHMWPSFWWSQFNYKTGIDPNTHQQYTEDIQLLARPSDFPDWPLFVSTFGQNQCYLDPTKGSYRPSSVVFWLNMVVPDGRWGGSCFGLATSSFQAFDDQATFLNYFPGVGGFNQLYDLDTTITIRRINNELWLSQLGNEPQAVANQKWQLKPSETVNELRAMLLDENRDDKTLSIDNQILSGSHAVSPYKIEHDPVLGGNWFRIYIYDNNAPANANRYIEVDTAANYWNYNVFSSRGWGGSEGLYLMDPVGNYYSTFTLGVKAHPGIVQRNALQVGPNTMKILNTPGTGIAILDAGGDTLGYSDSVVTSKIPNGRPIIPKTGGFFPPIGYQMPTGDYSVTMSAFSDTSVHFAAFTDSSVFSFQRSGVQANETDHLKIGTGYDVVNHDATTKLANLQSIVIRSDNEKVVSLKNVSITQDDSVHLDIVNRQNLHVINAGDTVHYDLSLQYASAEGVINFKHAALVVPGHGAVQIVPSWDSMAYEPAKVLIDHTNSGIFDDSVIIDNQTIGWYPDSIHMTPPYITGGKQALGSVKLNAVAPHGGMLVNLTSSVPLYASVPPSIFIPTGQQAGSFNVTTSVVAVAETVMISASANGITRVDTFAVLPQGIESLTLNPAGGVIGGDSALCTITLSNPAPPGGTPITVANGKPAIATMPTSVNVPEGADMYSFTIYTVPVQHFDSVLISASSSLRQASAKLYVSSAGTMTFQPDTVVGGNSSTLYYSISVPAPPSGLTIDLKSSDTTVARTSPSLTIAPGALKGSTSVTTLGVAQDTVITFSVTNSPLPVSGQLLVGPANLSSLSASHQNGCFVGQHGPVDPGSYLAGNPILFQVALDGLAPSPAGATLRVASDHPSVLPVDSMIVVPSTNSQTTFTSVSDDAITTSQRVVVTVTYHGKSLKDTLTIVPRPHYRVIEFGDSVYGYSAWSVNNSGTVLGTGPQGLYLWKNGQITLMSSFPGFGLSLYSGTAINDSGHIVGTANGHAAYWKPDTTIMLGIPPGYVQGTGIAINDHDDVLGTVDTSINGFGFGERACVWSGGSMTVLDNYGQAYRTYPYGINNARQVVGKVIRDHYGFDFGSAGLLWENGSIAWSLPGSTFGPYYAPIVPSANAINDSGIIAGEYYLQPAYTGQGWFIRRGTDTINFPSLPPYYGMSPRAINRSGVIVGNMWEDDFETSPVAFIFKDGYYLDLNCITDSLLPGRELSIANSINDQGMIVGAVRILRTNTTRACVLVPSGISLGVDDTRGKRLPTAFKLDQNFPNPFNPATTINYELPKSVRVTLKVYNILGQEVAQLVDQQQPAGYYSVRFGGVNLSSGVYFYRLTAGNFVAIKKMMLMK